LAVAAGREGSIIKSHKDMKSKFIPKIIKMARYAVLSALVQCLFSGMLLANDTFAQEKHNIDKVFLKVELRNASLKDALMVIESKTEFRFVYNEKIFDKPSKINISKRSQSLGQILRQISDETHLAFKLIEESIHISEKNKVEGEVQNAPKHNVSGTVTSSSGEALPGVNVIVKGTSLGIITDAQGTYTISGLNENDILVFSFIGFLSKEVPVNGQSVINVIISEDVKGLKELVVVGYGTQQRGTITGAIASVSTRSIENQPLTGLDQAMAGQVAGVRVAQTTGTPGGGATVRVRGTGSIGAGNEPLYVIDGFPVEGDYSRNYNPLSTINPNDIESIEILKDASAAAIYGSRGSNGVVLITTKKGKAGKPTFRFDTYFGLQEVAYKVDMLNAREYAEYNTEARNNAWVDRGGKATDPNSVRPGALQIPPMFTDPASLGKGTDWLDEVFQTAPIKNYQLSASGGNEQTQYFVSGGYLNQEGIVIQTGFERYSLRINLDTKLSKRLKLGLNLAPSYSKNQIRSVEDQQFGNGILASALSMPPTIPVYNPDGTYSSLMQPTPYNLGIIENPVAIAEKTKNNGSSFRTLGTVYADLSIIEGLNFRTSLGGDYIGGISSFYHPSDLGRFGAAAPVLAQATASTNRNLTWLNENTLTYSREFNEKHNLNALIGYSSQKSHFDGSSLSATNFPNDLVTTLNAGQVTSGGTYASEWSLLSYLGRINYNFKNKYLFTATVRRDGSSRFGSDNKWGTFPSASVGWYISEEDFFKNQRIFGDLKLRASYGLAGNNNIGSYSHIGLLSSSKYVFGSGSGTVINGLYPSSINNVELGWEVSNQLDIGMDFGLLKNRLFFVIDYYNKNTSDLLLNVPVPASTGFSNALQNIGKVNNKGWEFSVNSKNLINQFKWNTDFNISFNRNKVIALGPSGAPIISKSSGFSPNTHISQIGSPLGMFWGYEAIGIYQTQEEVNSSPSVGTSSRPGDLKFRDVNGDGKITPDDITIIGTPHPDFTYGMNNNFSYKNFSLSVFIDGAQGFEVLNGSRRNIGFVNGGYSRRDVLGRWQSPENPGDGKTPRATTAVTPGNTSYVSTLLIEDASFLRIRNINLRYQLPQNLFKNIPVQNANIYLSVQNAHTFTKYKGFNPEQNLNGASALTPGVDFNGYPIAKVLTLGVNLTF
jgi:TonB-linked SusC/RagA family outer membrane protein